MIKLLDNYMRIGYGYDVHRLIKGRPLILGGVKIPFDKGLLGHSDADVLTHAICDALLGASALGDIGQHFPDTDPAYKNIISTTILEQTYQLISSQGYEIINIDATIIAEAPKISPYRESMREILSDILFISLNQINIKATTTEGLGYLGKGEGIAATCVVLLSKTLQ